MDTSRPSALSGASGQCEKDECIEALKAALQRMRGKLLTAGLFGSQDDDLDVLIVLSAPSWPIYDELCSLLHASLPNVSCYPTFRLQEFVAATTDGTSRPRLHLLVYPSIAVFNQVERPIVRYCMARTFKPLLGSVDTLLKGNRNKPPPDIAFYENLLFETAQLYFMRAASATTLVREVRSKLRYVVKFALLETVYTPNGSIDLTRIARTLFNPSIHRLCAEGGLIYSRLVNWHHPTDGDVRKAFSDVMAFLRKLKRASKG